MSPPHRRSSDADMDLIKQQLQSGTARMDNFEKTIEANTRTTEANATLLAELRDILASAKAGLRLLGWLGVASAWIAGLSAAAIALFKFVTMVKGGDGPK